MSKDMPTDPNKHKIQKPYISILLILVSAFLGGGIGAFSKMSLQEIPPLSFTLLRFLLAILVLLGEKITTEFMIGSLLAFIGVALVTILGGAESKKEFTTKVV